MFDATISDNSLDPSSLISNDFSLVKSDLFSNSTSQDLLSFNTNFDINYSDLSSNAWESQMVFPQSQLSGIDTTLAPQSAQTSIDPLTGMGVNDSLAENVIQASVLPQSPLAMSASSGLSFVGDLKANQFTIPYAGYSYVISGNGNVDFGSGYRDFIDLYGISYQTVGFNLASTTGGGVLYDPGNGTRVFDAMYLSDGTQILFEGIDSIRFSEGTVDLSVLPNDPSFNSQWNLHMMGVQNAWRFSTGSTGVLIGVQDTGLGIDSSGYNHPDLGLTYFDSNNYRDDYSANERPQNISHGTSVQGIIAAASNNGYGISGINWNSSVYNIDVLGGNYYDQSYTQATQNMINFANSYGQKLVVNMSLGGDPNSVRDYAFEELVANNRNNALFVIASGNEDASSLSYPAWLAYYYDNVIAVGASWGTSDSYGYSRTPGERISYASFGGWGSNYGAGLTLMGPSEVLTTNAIGTSYQGAYQFDYNGHFGGTSAATPNVAGVASLVWSANGNLSAGQVKTILSQTSFDLGTSGYDYVYGSGFVNADAAVRQAMAWARMGYSYSSSSASPIASALEGDSFVSNTSLSANSTVVDSLRVAYADSATTIVPSLDSLESVEFDRDNTNSDRTDIALSPSTNLETDGYDAIPSMTKTTDLEQFSSQASRLLSDGDSLQDNGFYFSWRYQPF